MKNQTELINNERKHGVKVKGTCVNTGSCASVAERHTGSESCLTGSSREFHSAPGNTVTMAELMQHPVMMLCGCSPQELLCVCVCVCPESLTKEEGGGYYSTLREGLCCPC